MQERLLRRIPQQESPITLLYFGYLPDVRFLKPVFKEISYNLYVFKAATYRYMYLKKAWYLKTYIDTNSFIDFEKLH